tara:strand:- start:255 stop:614 length:360 start_codon:yes stop_codon:yes gene_type:complete
MTEEKEMWSVDELVAMVDEVQTAEIEYAGKALKIQWCELVEAEEPKMAMPDDSAPSEEQTEYYKQLAGARCLKMIEKANEKSPETTSLNAENWEKLPTTLRWQLSSKILGQTNENFTSG